MHAAPHMVEIVIGASVEDGRPANRNLDIIDNNIKQRMLVSNVPVTKKKKEKKEKVKYVRSSTNDGAIGWMAGRIRFPNPRGLVHSM